MMTHLEQAYQYDVDVRSTMEHLARDGAASPKTSFEKPLGLTW